MTMNVGFIRIFWGLLFVVLDIRINSVDLILPDFVGYILIVSGLSLLVPHDKWFRTARLVAVVLIFVSLTTLVEVKVDSKEAPRLKREWISTLTGDLGALLPEQVGSARLMRTTSAGTEIDANRSHNPSRDEDRILAEYSDGTIVMVLRYGSPDDALQAMNQKSDSEYSTDALRKRAETDASFRASNISHQHGSTGGEITTAAHSRVEVADRVIQQWWNRGWSWWKPASWTNEGGWSGGLLYIVEGYRNSADNYKSAFEGKNGENGDGITIDPLFPIAAVGYLLDALLIWAICSGIIALSLSSGNFGLMEIAKKRRNLYLVLSVPALVGSMAYLFMPEAIFNFVKSGGTVLLVAYVFLVLTSVFLIMGLVRKAAHTLK